MQTTDDVVQVNVSLPYFTNMPEDVIVNTFHLIFDAGGGTLPTNTDYGNLADNLDAFYEACYTAPGLKANWTGNTLTMKFYRLILPEPRPPAFTTTRTIAAAGNDGSVPIETCVCLSYRANYIAGVSQARQRGRIFMGGFATLTDVGTTTKFPEINVGTRTKFCNAMSAFRTACLADNWTWVVLSPSQVRDSLQETFDVAGGWVDNEPDTQRRRGFKSLVRTTW